MDLKKQKYSSEIRASQAVLKKIIPQLLLSVSLFSFLLSYSSSLVYSPKFHCYFSASSFQLLSNALNKNCLFLICNGLLVFLAKTSGFVGPPSGHDLNEMLQKRIGDSLERYHVLEDEEEEEEEKKSNESPKEVSIFIAESEEEEAKDCDHLEKYENLDAESRSCWLFDDHDDEQLYGQEVDDEEDEDDEEDDDDDNDSGNCDYDDEKQEMSTEELNQKIEDFIRRMKEEIIINEARRKVVIVK